MTSIAPTPGSRTPIRIVAGVVAILLAAVLVRITIVGWSHTRQINDLEAYTFVGTQTARGSDDVYEHVSPVRRLGPFLYPPSAAVLFVPLGWTSYDAWVLPFTVLKLATLAVLAWGAIRFSGAAPRDPVGWLLAIGLTTLAVHRFLDSDMKNGQVNLFVALGAAAGGWLLMSRGSLKWLGGVMIGLGAALKLTPALILALPIVHRRWGPAATAAATVAIIVVGLPLAWFGPAVTSELHQRYREVMEPYLVDSRDGPRQATLNELAQFTLTGLLVSDEAAAAARSNPPPIGPRGPDDIRLPVVISTDTARATWFGLGLAAGIGYLVVRGWIFRGRPADWTWDLAMLCTFMVMLSPQVRKAHLVVLIVPVAWMACRWLELGRRVGSLGPPARARPLAAAASLLAIACLVVADDLAIPLPGLPLPHRPALLVGMALLMVAMTRLVVTWPAEDTTETSVRTAASPARPRPVAGEPAIVEVGGSVAVVSERPARPGSPAAPAGTRSARSA